MTKDEVKTAIKNLARSAKVVRDAGLAAGFSHDELEELADFAVHEVQQPEAEATE